MRNVRAVSVPKPLYVDPGGASYHHAEPPADLAALLPTTETFILMLGSLGASSMDDVVAIQNRNASDARPRLDLQEHLADLEAKGLLVRIDHPVDKDTELHPLVRLQFIGGVPAAAGRALLFPNVVDAARRGHDKPVVGGAVAGSARGCLLCLRAPVEW